MIGSKQYHIGAISLRRSIFLLAGWNQEVLSILRVLPRGAERCRARSGERERRHSSRKSVAEGTGGPHTQQRASGDWRALLDCAPAAARIFLEYPCAPVNTSLVSYRRVSALYSFLFPSSPLSKPRPFRECCSRTRRTPVTERKNWCAPGA